MLRTLGKDVAIYGAADFAIRFAGFAVFPVYAHVFSVEEFGIYALVAATAGIVALVANMGLNNAAQREYWDPQIGPTMQPRVVSTGLGVLMAWACIVVVLALAGLYPVRDGLFARYGVWWTLAAIAILTIVPEQVLQYCLDTLRLHFAPWKFVLVSLLKNLLGIAIGLVLILQMGRGLEGLFLGALIGALAAVPVALALIRKDLTLALDPGLAKRMVSFGYPFIFAGAAYWLFGVVDRWMLAELSDGTQLGLYAIAYKFAAVVLFLNTAFGQAWSPFALKLRADDAGYRGVYARVFSAWFFFLVVVGASLALFGLELLRVLTPPEYWAAAPALGILVMGVVLSGTTQITAVGISLERRTRLFAAAAWTTALANILFNFLLIPRWGALGAAVATLLSYGLLTGLYLYWSQRLHPLPLEKPKLFYSACSVPIMAAAPLVIAGMDAGAPAVLKLLLLAALLAGGALFGILDPAIVRRFIMRRREA
jgi:O-antigen/teichoic acid export membrane protein